MKALASLLVVSAPVLAWDGKIELGGMLSRGNSSVNQLKAALELRHSAGDYSMELNADGLRETGLEGAVTAERGSAQANLINKSEWTRGQYCFVAPIWRYNRFGYLVRVSEVFAGVGWQWGESPAATPAGPPVDAWRLRFETGPGYRYSRLSTDEAWSEPVWLLRSKGEAPLNEHLRIEGEVALEAGERVTELINKLALAQRIGDHLELKLAWYQTRAVPVAPDKKPTDSSLTLSLAYAF